MSGSDFEVKGLDDLSEKLLSAIEEFPGTAEKGLITIGNKLKKECVKNTPKGSTGKLKKGWKHKVEGYNGSELTYELVNRHPVHHLLNNGHVKKTPGGRTVGYYEGRHYTEKSVKQFEASDLQPGLERLMKKLLRKAGGT
jgi:hypothetical protein